MDQNMTHTSRTLDRRSLLRIGGLSITTAALVAACGGQTEVGELGRVGNGEPNPALPDATVDDAARFRTSASVETSIGNALETMLAKGWLDAHADKVAAFVEHHRAAAEACNAMAAEVGGEAWTCGNPRLDSAYIDVVIERIENGAEATDNAAAIEPSDDPARDAANLMWALEELSAETCQAMVAQVMTAAQRVTLMELGVRSGRQAAATALAIHPGGYLPNGAVIETPAEGDAPAQTPIPLPVALPSTFGALGAITYIGGKGDENGVRLKVNFETPSLNSIVYSFDTCS
ncbi:MAG: hypothetical protein RJB65_1740 [Actinomycetota bacterium]